MAPDAVSRDLLYETNQYWVNVFSYPAMKLEGQLKNFDSAVGDCVDKSGNVYVTNQLPPRLYEYAHGGTKRIATLAVPKLAVAPVGCSIDPTTGNLAVTGFSHGADVFEGARGKPKFYEDKGYYAMQFCAYDDKGNLFVNGAMTEKNRSQLVELAKGATKFVNITLEKPTNVYGGIQWAGSDLAIGGYFPIKSGKPVLYRYSLNGEKGNLIGMTPLGPPAYQIFQFFIDDATVIAPNWAKTGARLYSILTYDYPKGGAQTSKVIQHMDHPRAVVLSRSQTSLDTKQ
jgi:hypothetical protein